MPNPFRSEEAAFRFLWFVIAYLALIAGVSEWPFETSTLVQFGAYLALPVGSWLGGAIASRLIALWWH